MAEESQPVEEVEAEIEETLPPKPTIAPPPQPSPKGEGTKRPRRKKAA
jgi:hypothetical protein